MIRKIPQLQTILILVTVVLAAAGLPLQAQFSDDIDITFTPEQEELNVGDLVELTLSVKHPEGYQVTFPELPQAWGDYEVRSQLPPKTISNRDGSETTNQVIIVTLFAPGIYQTPSINLSLHDNDNQLIERVVPQLSLTVTPLLAPDDAELRDIKPQFALDPLIPWAWLAGGLLLAVVLLLAARWLYKRLVARLGKESGLAVPLPVIDTRPPYLIAYEELARIEGLDLPGQGRFKEYYSLVTDCLRNYLGGMYDIPAIDLTTAEIKCALGQSRIASDFTHEFIGLFSEGDLVKFARFVPRIEDARPIIGKARGLVDATKIIAVPEDEAATGPVTETEMVTQEAV